MARVKVLANEIAALEGQFQTYVQDESSRRGKDKEKIRLEMAVLEEKIAVLGKMQGNLQEQLQQINTQPPIRGTASLTSPAPPKPN